MPTGIGDYSFELLPHLAPHYRCTVVAEDQPEHLRAPAGIRLLRLQAYLAEEAAHAAAIHLYMIGNNPDHLYMLPVLARHPGVVVLHDPGLHHLLDCATAALGDIEGYAAAVEAEYGAPGRLLAEQWQAHELRDRQMLRQMPMLRQLLGRSRHVVVHSRYAAFKALAQAPHVPLTIAPHQYSPPAERVPRAEMRRRLGIGEDELVFLSLGFVSHIKRVDTALRALARVAGRMPRMRFVVAGEIRRDELDVERLAAALGLGAAVLITGFVPEADFFGMIGMADVVINLRHPVGGETSGTLIRALGSGACVVVIDEGPFAEIPDGAAVKLPWGPEIEAMLADALLRLAISPAARAQIGARAAAEIGARNDPARTAAAYRAAIDAAAGSPATRWAFTTPLRYLPVQRIGQPGPLWARLDLVPRTIAACDVLAVADAADVAALRRLGHAPVRAPLRWRPEQEPARGWDIVLIRLLPDSPWPDDAALAGALNRMLRFGGILVLCVTGIDPRARVLAAHGAGEALLRGRGFRVDAAAAAAPPTLAEPEPPSGEEIVFKAVKVSAFGLRDPLAA
jgi:glycosyltransferase involved in cell wall biosynthesis